MGGGVTLYGPSVGENFAELWQRLLGQIIDHIDDGNGAHAGSTISLSPAILGENDLQDALEALVAADLLLIPLAQRAAANGVATLGADSKIPTSQIPALAIGETHTVASQVAMLALDADRGDIAIRTDLDPDGVYWLGADDATQLANWIRIGAVDLTVDGAAAVPSLRTLGTAATQAAKGDAVVNLTGDQSRTGSITLVPSAANATPLILKGAAAQTAPVLTAQTSAGVNLTTITAGGDLTFHQQGTAVRKPWTMHVATAGHNNFGALLAGGSFSGVYDDTFAIGYNPGHLDTTEPTMEWVVENDYHNGTERTVECYWQFWREGPGANYIRPISFLARRGAVSNAAAFLALEFNATSLRFVDLTVPTSNLFATLGGTGLALIGVPGAGNTSVSITPPAGTSSVISLGHNAASTIVTLATSGPNDGFLTVAGSSAAVMSFSRGTFGQPGSGIVNIGGSPANPSALSVMVGTCHEATIGFRVRGRDGQLGNLISAVDSANTSMFSVSPVGNIAAAGTLTAAGLITGGAGLAITGAATVSTTLGVTGLITGGAGLNLTGALAVTGAMSGTSTLTLGGTVDLTATAGARQLLLYNAGSFEYGLQVIAGTTRLYSAAGDGVSFGTKTADTFAYTEWAKLTSPGAAETAAWLLVNDGAVTSLRRVTVGAADSGGSGKRMLVVAN